MSNSLDRICTVDISLASPISNDANFDNILILGPAPANPTGDVPAIGVYNSLEELTALGKPTVMVPSPYVTNNHQEKNARLLEKHGGAVVITEPESTGDGLYKAVEAILSDNEKRISMARAMKELGIPNATARIYDTVMALVRK